MARPLRIEYPDACYHVTNRGLDKKAIFPADDYCQAFLQGVSEASQRFNVDVVAWCLLKHEYHLLVKTPEANLSRFMRQVDGLYTQQYQRIKKSNGSVFRSRYKAVLVQEDPYLLPLTRFIHSLPAQYRLDFKQYRWSSYQQYVNAAEKSALRAEKNLVLTSLGKGNRLANRYADYVNAGVDAELQHFYGKKNLLSILGDQKFKQKARGRSSPDSARGVSRGAAARKRPSIKQVVKLVAGHYEVSEDSIYHAARGPGSKNLPRWVAMYLCQEIAGVTLQAIAEKFGLKRYGTVSTTIGKLKQELALTPRLQTAVRRLAASLSAG
jgi:putative transposase